MAKKSISAFIDLIIFLSTMFLVREVYFDSLGFWGNALFKSLSTVGIATLLLYVRKQSWKDIGLTKPNNIGRFLVTIAITLTSTIVLIMVFQIFFADLMPSHGETAASVNASKAEKSVGMILFIVTAVWVESFLEELQDRGFSLNRLEALIGYKPVATIFAVLMQAAIFGFRHSYDFSERSITTGLIGLGFGIVYVLSGRNLWPLIIAHIVLNSMSIFEKL